MRVTDAGGRSCWGRFVQDGQPCQGLALPRLVLDHLLVQQACREGVELRTGLWVRQPVLEGQRVSGVSGQQTRRPTTVRARLVIAADGLHSTLARRLGLVRRVRWLQHVALVTHYTGVSPIQPWGEMFLIPSGYIGVAPVSDALVNVSVVVRAAHLTAAQETPEVFFARTVHAHPELRQRFARAVRSKKLLTLGPMAQRTACPQHGGILFIGDAAGFFDPFTGQGIYLALHSAVLAATVAHRALCSGDVSACHLHSYWAAYRQAFGDKYRLSALIQLGLRVPWLASRVIDRLAHRPTLADTVVSVAGDLVSPRAVLSWRFATQALV
jgi:flavin-dependent dehydrogenase